MIINQKSKIIRKYILNETSRHRIEERLNSKRQDPVATDVGTRCECQRCQDMNVEHSQDAVTDLEESGEDQRSIDMNVEHSRDAVTDLEESGERFREDESLTHLND